ncbi:MAG: Transcriptional regulator, LacI family [Pedosphaera sp.]|nr:Transcriptional regulator, LacI family [Pedosphaera sp.]
MTVSKVMRNAPDISAATKARVKTLALQMGYVPDSTAQSLRTRTSRFLGVVISSITNPSFARVLLAIEERAHELGFDIILAQTLNKEEREEACIQRLMARRVDGIFISPVYRLSPDAPIYQALQARKTPVVILGHAAPFCRQFASVESDDILGSYAITQHLLQLGHRNIAFFAGPHGAPWSQERFEGYRRALRESGLEVDDRLIFQAGNSIEDGAKAALQFMNEATSATAIQAVNDLVAIGCANTLLNQGIKIPQDLSVVGFGNILTSEYFRVPLTTIRQPKFRLGSAAMDSMMKLLQGERPEVKRLRAEIVVRSSTAAPAKVQLASPAQA